MNTETAARDAWQGFVGRLLVGLALLALGASAQSLFDQAVRTQAMPWMMLPGLALLLGAAGIVVRRGLRERAATSVALDASRHELQASEHRIRAMADALPILIAYVDRTETCRFTNRRFDAFFGEPATSVVGRTLRDLLGAAYAANRIRIEAALAGTPQTFERCHRQHGGETHLLIHYVPDLDDTGAVAGLHLMVLDITARKTAELARQVNERRLRAITDNVPAIIAHLDRDHRYLHANESFRRLQGLEPDAMIGKTLREIRGEAVWTQLADHLLGVLRGETRRLEVREVIDGVEHHLQQSIVPEVDADGTVVGYTSVSFDITDLRRSEQLLMETSARHRAIVEGQSELVSLATSDGELLYVNPAYARHFGFAPAAMVGTSLFDFVAATDRAAVRATVARVFDSGAMHSSESRMRHGDGTECWVAWTHTLQRDASGHAKLRSVGRDVTDRRRAEEALRASEESLARTGRLAGVGGYEVDLERGRVVWSAEVRRILDVADDFEPTVANMVAFFAPEAQPAIVAAVDAARTTGSGWDLELPLFTATGRRIWVRSVGDAETVGGKAARLVGALQDITGRKLAELAVEHQERLLRAVTDNLPVLAMYVDQGETVRFLNATGETWLGGTTGVAVGRSLREVLGEQRYGVAEGHIQQALAGEPVDADYEEAMPDGRMCHMHISHRPDRRRDGSVAGSFVMVTDVTANKRVHQQLELLARVDVLTGLPNRRQFDERLDEALRRACRSGQRLAVMFLDVDHFKSINDSLGHAGGDAVLRQFAGRVRGVVRETDLVARLAGDEFVVLLEGLVDDDDASTVAAKIVAETRAEFVVSGTPLRVTTSLGVAVTAPAASTPPSANDLLRCADKALYQAKRDGRDGYRLSIFDGMAVAD